METARRSELPGPGDPSPQKGRRPAEALASSCVWRCHHCPAAQGWGLGTQHLLWPGCSKCPEGEGTRTSGWEGPVKQEEDDLASRAWPAPSPGFHLSTEGEADAGPEPQLPARGFMEGCPCPCIRPCRHWPGPPTRGAQPACHDSGACGLRAMESHPGEPCGALAVPCALCPLSPHLPGRACFCDSCCCSRALSSGSRGRPSSSLGMILP